MVAFFATDFQNRAIKFYIKIARRFKLSFKLPDLLYDFSALEPHIDARTMEIHHDKHHGGYVNKLNAALEKAPGLQDKSIEELMGSLESAPENVKTAIRNNGGVHFNHSLFWKVMAPSGGGRPTGEILRNIERGFNSFDAFRDRFSNAALTLFGSGWAWLAVDGTKNLTVLTTPNQDNPLMSGLFPILGIDVWEHAYYLKYQNRRADYIGAFWNIINWSKVNNNLEKALEKDLHLVSS
jgi:Fe-Mn family superoxide dismutase